MRCLALTLALLFWAAPARARGTCTVEGRAVLPFVVTVTPRETAPFKLRVAGVAAAITPGGLGATAQAHVKEPLAFDGAVEPSEIPARTRRATEALNGLLRLAPATEQLVLHANVRAKIVDAEVRLGGVTFRGLALPCDALTLDAVPEPPTALAHENPDAARFVAAGKLIHFRGAPNGGTSMEAALDEPDELELRETESSGAWVRVTSQWPDGALLTAWVNRDELKPAGLAHEPLDRVPGAVVGCIGRDKEARSDVGRTAVADVKPGTQVFAARYLGPWAKVVAGAKLTVRYLAKDDWIQIVQVPHIAGASVEDACDHPLDSAWIARAAATLPAEPSPSGAPPAGAPPAAAPPVAAGSKPAPAKPTPAKPAPATSAPTTSAPATSAPASSAPASSAPATSAPATSAPATSASTTSAPATSAPAKSGPTASAPSKPGQARP